MSDCDWKQLNHENYMTLALQAADRAQAVGEVPVGAVVVTLSGQVIAEAGNVKETEASPTGHAEIRALEAASRSLGRWRLSDCVLYVTLEPCLMCAGAILSARIKAVVYGTHDAKAGAVHSLYEVLNDSRLNHRCEVVSGIQAEACARRLSDFFRNRRHERKAARD